MTIERKTKLMEVLSKRQFNLTVVLENVFDPHNIAAVMRTCDAVGVQEIYVLNTMAAPQKKWSTKTSSSANKWITIHQFSQTAACVEALKADNKKIITTKLTQPSPSLYDINFCKNIALVFGNEHGGLSDEFYSQADQNLVIPQMGIIQSLNISVACAVCLYEALRQKQAQQHYVGQAGSFSTAQVTLGHQWGLEDLTHFEG